MIGAFEDISVVYIISWISNVQSQKEMIRVEKEDNWNFLINNYLCDLGESRVWSLIFFELDFSLFSMNKNIYLCSYNFTKLNTVSLYYYNEHLLIFSGVWHFFYTPID